MSLSFTGLGVAVGLPFLEAMRPGPLVADSGDRKGPPLRMAFLYVPNGVHMPSWTPRTLGAAFDLPAILENRFGQYYAPGGTKDLSSAAVVKGQTGHQRRSASAAKPKPVAKKAAAKKSPGKKK